MLWNIIIKFVVKSAAMIWLELVMHQKTLILIFFGVLIAIIKLCLVMAFFPNRRSSKNIYLFLIEHKGAFISELMKAPLCLEFIKIKLEELYRKYLNIIDIK